MEILNKIALALEAGENSEVHELTTNAVIDKISPKTILMTDFYLE